MVPLFDHSDSKIIIKMSELVNFQMIDYLINKQSDYKLICLSLTITSNLAIES